LDPRVEMPVPQGSGAQPGAANRTPERNVRANGRLIAIARHVYNLTRASMVCVRVGGSRNPG